MLFVSRHAALQENTFAVPMSGIQTQFKAIQTLWPLPVNPGQLLPCTKLVFGRGVGSCCRPLQIMWTTTEVFDSNTHINHFVPLIERPTELAL